MPRKKSSAKKTAGKRKKGLSAAKTVRKRVGRAAKAASGAGKRARKAAAKVTGAVKKQATKIASNPKRTVRRAADNVHQTAVRARAMGDSVVTAGELLKETADFVDSMSLRAKARTRGGTRKKGRPPKG